MAAILPTGSEQYVAASTYKKDGIYDTGLCMAYGKFTCTQAGTGTVTMFVLPPGRLLIYPGLSAFSASDMSANADLHIGHGAYTEQNGTVQVADDNEWFDNIDIGGGAKNHLFNVTSVSVFADVFTPLPYNSKAGIPIQVMIDTGDCDLTDTIEVMICYAKEGTH